MLAVSQMVGQMQGGPMANAGMAGAQGQPGAVSDMGSGQANAAAGSAQAGGLIVGPNGQPLGGQA
jgi:hypothetical protein